MRVFPHGAVEIMSEATSKILKVNGQRLKSYFDGFKQVGAKDVPLGDPEYS